MAIDATHPDYDKYKSEWEKIRRVVDSDDDVMQYLRYLNPHDTKDANKARNKAYKEFAVFYGLSERTLDGMVGTVFEKQPALDVPPQLEYLTTNVDGRGNSIYQQSQAATRENLSLSRGGLYVSYPSTNGGLSQEEVNSGKYFATISDISAERIINWDEESDGAVSKLSLVVFTDAEVEVQDYKRVSVPVIRELYLDDGVYTERKWRKSDGWVPDDPVVPLDAKGNPFGEIQFTFYGGINNDSDIDKPAMKAMTNLNLAHYRNSADYEDSVWYAGQAQPWMSGITQNHVDLMKKNNMYAGSRNVLGVPTGETFDYASAPPNPLVRQAMLDKVDMMIGIGARMITPGGVAKTAEQSNNESKIQHSMMSLAASNISDAYTRCINWVGMRMGVDASNSFYKLNDDYMRIAKTPQELREVISGYVAGTIPVGDYHRYLQEYGLADEDQTVEDFAASLGD